MSDIPPIPLIRGRFELRKRLNIDAETFSLMMEETEVVYQKLMSDKRHLKWGSKRTHPPFTWNDLLEESKILAMTAMVRSSKPQTRLIWNRAAYTAGYSNWITRWFLYYRCRLSCYRVGFIKLKDLSSGKHHHGKSMTLAPTLRPLLSRPPHDSNQKTVNRVYFDPVRDAIATAGG